MSGHPERAAIAPETTSGLPAVDTDHLSLQTKSEVEDRLTSPFDLLASELIGQIIISAVRSTDHWSRPAYEGDIWHIYFPYTALLISNLWHSVVMSTPGAWASIFVRSSHPDSPKLASKLRHHSKYARNLPVDLIYFLDDRPPLPGDAIISTVPDVPLRLRKVRIGATASCHPDIFSLSPVLGIIQGRKDVETFTDLEIVGDIQVDPTIRTYGNYPWRVDQISFRTLRRLSCNNINFTRHGDALNLPNLEELRLEKVKTTSLDALFHNAHLPALRLLGIQCMTYSYFSTSLPSDHGPFDLRAPSLRQAVLFNVRDEITQTLLSTSSNLETLVLNCRVGGNSVQFPALKDPRMCPDLRTLAVCDGPWECLHAFLLEVVEARVPILRQLVVTPDIMEPDSDEEEAKDIRSRIREQVDVAQWTTDKFAFESVFDRVSQM